LKRLFRAIKAEVNVENRKALKAQLKKVNKQLKSRTRKAINEYKREQVAEIERLENMIAEECGKS
jgi:hypothetical protein